MTSRNIQALTSPLVDHVQSPEGLALKCAVVDEVIGPDVVRPLGQQPDAGSLAQTEPVPDQQPGKQLQLFGPPKVL